MLRKAVAFILIALAVYASFYFLMPQYAVSKSQTEETFSTQRALAILKPISEKPHFVGSRNHEYVRSYIVDELTKLGLEVQVQEGFSMSKDGNLSKPKNVITRIPGRDDTEKGLLLMSHYDSNPHSSLGASDAGSGVVTILEGIRAYLSEGRTPKNDIVILFTDSEELGLNGADIFVNKHPWAKNVGLVLNFEARGSGGPSYMLIETNQGNEKLMQAFVEANPDFPVANSLAYSIYKMLPNDTDLTVFRTDGDIDGFNFAFIDDHYDYHTVLDNYTRLDRNSLEHQGSYLMPLLHYFSEADLTMLKSQSDDVYFNVPLWGMVTYPFSWVVPLLLLAYIVFVFLVFYGIHHRRFTGAEILQGAKGFFMSFLLSGLIGFVFWGTLTFVYPSYGEILQGFTYNGHSYIAAIICLSLSICFYSYHKVFRPRNTVGLLVVPLFFWLLLSTLVAFTLKGASFFIVPVFFSLVTLFVLIRQKEPNIFLVVLLNVPLIFIMAPFVKMFPVGLGLKALLLSAVFTVLIFGLMIAVFGFYIRKNLLGHFFMGLCFLYLIIAQVNSGFNEEQPKPNSLVYLLNADNNSALWASYDGQLDSWTKAKLGDSPEEAGELSSIAFGSKYGTGFTHTNPAEIKPIAEPTILIEKDTLIKGNRRLSILLVPNRPVNRIELLSGLKQRVYDIEANGVKRELGEGNGRLFESNERILSYFVSDGDTLKLNVTVPNKQQTKFLFYEASFDLLSNPMFSVSKREPSMIPKPFVLNDAVIVKKGITIE
ncbi:M28 family peptidase [Mangrovimonas aestuarii]|uniref:M28 family peptidase n=1 Tax=Mangrovimonas aestuarii TaxID=3018443 RepID=UPI002379E56D|nr:M28 family peptidase [Mangrovimonas aestuarii]